jgi:hypothetical protein
MPNDAERGPMEQWCIEHGVSVPNDSDLMFDGMPLDEAIAYAREQDARFAALTAERDKYRAEAHLLNRERDEAVAQKDALVAALEAIDFSDYFTLDSAHDDELVIVRRPNRLWRQLAAALAQASKVTP